MQSSHAKSSQVKPSQATQATSSQNRPSQAKPTQVKSSHVQASHAHLRRQITMRPPGMLSQSASSLCRWVATAAHRPLLLLQQRALRRSQDGRGEACMRIERLAASTQGRWDAEPRGRSALVHAKARCARARADPAGMTRPPLPRVLPEEAEVGGSRRHHELRLRQCHKGWMRSQLLHAHRSPLDVGYRTTLWTATTTWTASTIWTASTLSRRGCRSCCRHGQQSCRQNGFCGSMARCYFRGLKLLEALAQPIAPHLVLRASGR